MKPKSVKFAPGWALLGGASLEVEAAVRSKLSADGDDDAETLRTIGGGARELLTTLPYRDGGYLRIRWCFENDETAELLKVEAALPDDEFDYWDEPPAD